MAMSQHPNLKLHSPAGVEPMSYKWPLQVGAGAALHDYGIEILDTIKYVCDDMPEIYASLEHIQMHEVDTTCYDSMRSVVDTYNKAIDSVLSLEKGTSLPNLRLNRYASKEMLRHVIQLVYNAGVTQPEKLNQYEPFSAHVYGETSYDLICEMIEQIAITGDDVFIDLGSGVGQVVLQMAGSMPLKSCIGIEQADVPSRYADHLDKLFKTWMKWFGKRISEYTLLKGDFLADEHREKINSATIVFVNNFAFGPNVDHQLKDRFADLRDGAKIVSSKSFCPLSFRITERNLSDIGTIMHVRQLSQMKGAVSWTDKSVTYYLHVIDRTKLERYFQRLKKGVDAIDTGSSRPSRSTRNNALKTGDSTDSDPDATNGSSGPNTRKVWNEFCYKENSNSEEENNNSNPMVRSKNGITPKKRKKLTRKAAIKAIQPAAMSVQKKRPAVKTTVAVTAATQKKGRKRNLKIVGLDLLHSHTLSSTSTELMSKKMPPAPGCVDQKLTSLTAGELLHQELDIPTAPRETPYALQILLDMYRNQFLTALDQMKSPAYKENVNKQIGDEKERHKNLLNRASQLEKQIKVLIDDSVSLLKTRMNELGISMTSQNDLLAKAKEIVGRHKELQIMAAKLQNQVGQIEQEQNSLIMSQMQSIAAKWSKNSSMADFELNAQTSHELVLKEIANTLSYRKKLQAQVSSLEIDMNAIESAAATATSAIEEKKAANALAAVTANATALPANGQTVHNVQNQLQPSTSSSSSSSSSPLASLSSSASSTSALSSSMSFIASSAPVSSPSQQQQHSKNGQQTNKSQRRSRDHRTRSLEWPDVPDVGKIEENNPELLAQKILETGRQIEAGCRANTGYKYKDGTEGRKPTAMQAAAGDNSLMPAPLIKSSGRSSTGINAINLPTKPYNALPSAPVAPTAKAAPDTPKVVNFESRLKSIITSALNEDQEHRMAQHKPSPATPQPMSAPIPPSQPSFQKSFGPTPSANAGAVPPASAAANFIYNSNTFAPNNSSLLIGTHHLNAATTISAVQPSATPPNTNHPDALYPNKYAPPAGGKHVAQTHHHQPLPPQQQHALPPQHYVVKGYDAATMNHTMHANNPLVYQQHQREKMSMEQHMHYAQMFDVKAEFKAPEKMRFERAMGNHTMDEASQQHHMGRVIMPMDGHRESMHYPVSGRASSHHQPAQVRPASTSSSSALPDYTQVSPAKMALRRHLSQEKLTQPQTPVLPTAPKTIGDLVNGEIERTLEITNQSIINAAINMSSLGGGRANANNTPSGAMINISAQRPERVNVRLMDEPALNVHAQFAIGGYGSRANSRERVSKSPIHLHGQSNLATLSQVAYNHKQPGQHPSQMPHANSMAQISPKANGAAYQQASHRYQTTSQSPSTSALLRNAHNYSTGSTVSNASTIQSDYSQSQPQPQQAPPVQKYMPLPRADMKPYLESYFADEQKAMLMQQQQQQQQHQPQGNHVKIAVDEKPRSNGAPLEGLAASLRARVVAQMKIKEEHEKRSDIPMPMPIINGNVTITPTQHIKTEADSGLKRSSPIVNHHRPAKMRHYDLNDSLLSPDSQHHSGRPSSTMELMSPEINSMASEDRPHIRTKHEDDDVGDDESHWQDRVSSGFDRLVAFASTELTKSRRSIEDGAPSTSPDSGINQSSDGRTFLSSSSSSSQLDGPTNMLRTVVPIMKSSPVESPPLSELPRTPSPSASPPPILYSQSPIMMHHTAENNLKIPLKYQRQSKSQSQKHYKKKFRERTWEYDEYDKESNETMDDLASDRGHYGGGAVGAGVNDVGEYIMSHHTSAASMISTHHSNHLHKSSKFRPKGKDWDWRGQNHETDSTHA